MTTSLQKRSDHEQPLRTRKDATLDQYSRIAVAPGSGLACACLNRQAARSECSADGIGGEIF